MNTQKKADLSIGICDDEKETLDLLKNELDDFFGKKSITYEIDCYTSSLAMAEAGVAYDIGILDVEIPGMDGFQLARQLLEKNSDVKLIFLSIYRERVQEAFYVHAFRYLYKPYEREEMEKALENALSELLDTEGVLLEYKGKKEYIYLKDIYYVESIGDVTVLVSKEGQAISSDTIKQWTERVGGRFVRCHRSYLVNLCQIQAVDKTKIRLESGCEVPVSVRNRKSVREKFQEYIEMHARII